MAAKELRVEEAMLTGESLPVTKKADAINEEGLTPGDQINMAFMGTVVVSGRGRGLIAENVRGVSLAKTRLQERFEQFARRLGLVVLGLCVLLFGVGFALGMERLELFMTAVGMSVAMIPEGLPVVYLPQLEWLVLTTPLSGSNLATILLLALSVVVTVELDKHLLRRLRPRSVMAKKSGA